jgi:hypothetical protein
VLQDAKRMLDPGTDASVQALDLVEYRIQSITQVQLLAAVQIRH